MGRGLLGGASCGAHIPSRFANCGHRRQGSGYDVRYLLGCRAERAPTYDDLPNRSPASRMVRPWGWRGRGFEQCWGYYR